MKRFFPILTASFCIIGLGAQVSSSMFLFPDASAEYESYATQPVDIMFLTPDEAYGMPLRTLKQGILDALMWLDGSSDHNPMDG